MSNDTKLFFMSLGLPLINVYGLSETSGATTYMEPPDISLEKAGKPLPGTQIKIFNPDEQGIGEICIKGRNVFMGYLNNPEATMEVMDAEGYFHTGDIGCLDPASGFLDITGRIKELIVTAGGENVSPIPIEVALKEACPIISHVVVIGDERKFLSALFTLKCRSDASQPRDTSVAPEVLSFLSGLGVRGKTTLSEIKQEPSVLTYIEKCVESVNSKAQSRVT
jgi:long-chain-fatty-acid--CoA ligase ACSBG